MHHATQHGPHLLVLLAVALPLVPKALSVVRRTAADRVAQITVAAALLAAAAVHVPAAQQHTGAQRAFLAGCAAVQVLLAWELLARPERPWLVAAVLIDAAIVLVWLQSRTVGIHYGLEPVGWADGVATALELAVLGSCARLLRGRPQPLRPDREIASWALIVVAGALALTA